MWKQIIEKKKEKLVWDFVLKKMQWKIRKINSSYSQ